MLMSRFGYHSLVIAWLVVLAVIDVVANTLMTGIMSDLYFYKVFLDGALIWWTVLYLREDLSGTITTAGSKKVMDRAHESVVVVNLGTSEYIYYGFLFFYGLGNFYFHHAINKQATGFMSMATLIISIADFVIAVIAGWNFYQVASGKVVKLQERLQHMQQQ